MAALGARMSPDKEKAERKARLADSATRTGAVLLSDETVIADFNKGCDHVHGLLRDSALLWTRRSYSTSLFLAITAIEEIAKLEIALYRSHERTAVANRRSEDHLYSHKSKHMIALQEVIAIGT